MIKIYGGNKKRRKLMYVSNLGWCVMERDTGKDTWFLHNFFLRKRNAVKHL